MSRNNVKQKRYKLEKNEQYMNVRQLEYFREKLLMWRTELLEESLGVTHLLKESSLKEPDVTDRASEEIDIGLELKSQDRNRKLVEKIDEALVRIERGVYGYCEETGDPIGIKRLEARPIATLSIAAQERHERFEKTHNDH